MSTALSTLALAASLLSAQPLTSGTQLHYRGAVAPLDEDGATKLMKLIDTLEELDDTDTVHANFDVDAEILERVAG